MSKKQQDTEQKKSIGRDLFHEELLNSQPLLDVAVESLRSFGFRQVFLPPVDDGELFENHEELAGEYKNLVHKLDGPLGEGKILPPTQLYNLFKFYFSQSEDEDKTNKWFYISPVPVERNGKVLINHELGVFVLGENSPLANVKVIHSVFEMLKNMGIENVNVEINNIGTEDCQEEYRDVLESHLTTTVKGDQLENCLEALDKGLPHFFDCILEKESDFMAESPQAVDYLDEESREEFVGLLESLEELEVPYILNPHMFSHPFQERTMFRFAVNKNEGLLPLISGGDYGFSCAHLQVDPVPSVGSRVLLEDLLGHVGEETNKPGRHAEVFVVSIGQQALKKSLSLFNLLRKNDFKVAEAMLGNRGIKDQLKAAEKMNPNIALIIGQKEAIDDSVIMRDMHSGMQEVFTMDRILEEVEKRLER